MGNRTSTHESPESYSDNYNLTNSHEQRNANSSSTTRANSSTRPVPISTGRGTRNSASPGGGGTDLASGGASRIVIGGGGSHLTFSPLMQMVPATVEVGEEEERD